jgi:hypothetical protein
MVTVKSRFNINIMSTTTFLKYNERSDDVETAALWDPLGAWPAARTWLWGVLAIMVSIVFIPMYVIELSGRNDRITDFFQDWASARNFLEGLPVYSNHRVTIPRYLGKTDLDESDFFVDVNAHPPTSILLFVPFAALPYPDAQFTWNALSLGMFAASLMLVWQRLRLPCSVRSVFPAIVLLLPCAPILMNIDLGQMNFLLLLILTGVWVADRADREILAGALLGTSVSIKLFPAVLFLFFLVKKRRRTVASGLVSIAMIAVLTVSVLGIQSYISYVNIVLPHIAKYRALWLNLSLPGYWRKLFDPAREYPFIQPITRNPFLSNTAIIVTCTILIGVLAWSIARARTRTELDLSFGLTMTAMLLVCPLTWDHYLILLLIPLAMAWIHLPRSRTFRILFMAILIAFWAWPYLVFDITVPGGRAEGTAYPIHTVTVGSYQCYALVALFLLQVTELRRSINLRLDPGPGRKDL